MRNIVNVIAIVLIIMGLLNAVFALVMIGVTKNPDASLTTDIQESRIDDLAHEEGYKERVSKIYTIYLIISLIVAGLGVFAFFYLKNLTVTLFPNVNIKFGDSFLWSTKSNKEKGH